MTSNPDAASALDASFISVVEHWALPVMVLDKALNFVFANDAYLKSTEKSWSDLEGQHVFSVFPDTPERVEAVYETFVKCLHGEQTRLEAQPFALTDKAGHETLHYWQATQEPLRDASGAVTHMVQYTEDVTDRINAENERKLVSGELNHRVKNILSVIQSIARLSSRGQESVPEFTQEFIERIAAMNRNHASLYENNFTGMTLEKLLSDELDAICVKTKNIYVLDGETVNMDVQLSKDMSMVIHELATNAAKYGCFSNDVGKLNVSWQRTGNITRVKWSETGVGPIGNLSENGFGSTLIRSVRNIKCDRVPTDDGLEVSLELTHA